MFVLGALVVLTILLAFAVRQLSYALVAGSLFESLRKSIRERKNHSVWFETLDKLFSCMLCMTMQVSLWTVMLPTIVLAAVLGVFGVFLGPEMSSTARWLLIVFGSFLYGMSVSGIAFCIWEFSRYPTKRYNEVVSQLEKANRANADLYRGILTGHIHSDPDLLLLSFEDFHRLMMKMREECKEKNGFDRREHRQRIVADWIKRWVTEDTEDVARRKQLAPVLLVRLGEVLSLYFSSHHDGVEEESLVVLFERVALTLIE